MLLLALVCQKNDWDHILSRRNPLQLFLLLSLGIYMYIHLATAEEWIGNYSTAVLLTLISYCISSCMDVKVMMSLFGCAVTMVTAN